MLKSPLITAWITGNTSHNPVPLDQRTFLYNVQWANKQWVNPVGPTSWFLNMPLWYPLRLWIQGGHHSTWAQCAVRPTTEAWKSSFHRWTFFSLVSYFVFYKRYPYPGRPLPLWHRSINCNHQLSNTRREQPVEIADKFRTLNSAPHVK